MSCYTVRKQRITIIIDSDDIESLDNLESFLRIKYPYYQGYIIAPPTYKPSNDYTGLDRDSMLIVEPYYPE